MTDSELLGYSAGLFDGEGCVTFYQRKDHDSIRAELTIDNTNPKPLLLLQQYWGGTVTPHRQFEDKRKNCFKWSAGGETGEKFARAIVSLTIIKKEELELYLQFRSTIGSKNCNEERKRILIASRILKSREWELADHGR